MPQTARDFITLAMKEAGVLGVGQTLLAEDINDGLTYLQRMTNLWQKKRWLTPALEQFSIVCDGSISYTIGSGGDLDIARPPKISAAWIVQNNTGSTPVSLPLRPIFSYEDYALINIKELNSLSGWFFYDAQWPLANFFPIPIASDLYTIYLVVQKLLNFPDDSLDTVFELPPEYEEAIHYNLAVRLCSAYQLPVPPDTRKLAKASLNTLRVTNTQVPRLGMPRGLMGNRGGFNLWNPDGYGGGS